MGDMKNETIDEYVKSQLLPLAAEMKKGEVMAMGPDGPEIFHNYETCPFPRITSLIIHFPNTAREIRDNDSVKEWVVEKIVDRLVKNGGNEWAKADKRRVYFGEGVYYDCNSGTVKQMRGGTNDSIEAVKTKVQELLDGICKQSPAQIKAVDGATPERQAFEAMMGAHTDTQEAEAEAERE